MNAYYTVYNSLGFGFLEKVYEQAMMIELSAKGLQCACQHPITVHYQGIEVGAYYADIIVEGLVILELKAVSELRIEHEVQLVNYLKATDIEVGLLLNFGIKPQIKRRMFTN